MNPDKSMRRGCFVRAEDNGTFTVVDYPTWTFRKYGLFTPNQTPPIQGPGEFERNFGTKTEAEEFCAEENYLVCAKQDAPIANDQADEYE